MAAASTPMMEKASAGMREIFSALSSSESRYFDEERYSESEIRKALNDNLTDRKIDAMKRILAAVSVGRDASPLFPDVVKNVSFQSLELKKLIYIYLVQYAENNRELALLSINSFQKDLSDRSQQVRASALRAMASIKVLEVIQLVMAAVKSAASDMSPYVRKTAAQCMTKVYAVDPDQFIELRTLLLKLMNDVEVQVVGSAVMAFRQICIIQPPRALVQASGEDGPGTGGASGPDAAARSQLELLHQNFKRLCQDVLLMDSWAQQSCIDLLMRYSRIFFACPDRQVEKEPSAGDGASGATNSPTVSEDLTLFLRALKLMLNSSSKGVTLASAVALCYLAPSQELSSVAMPLLRCLRQAPPESAASLLTAVTPLIEVRPDLFRPMIRDFFIQSFDSSSMKASKLKIIELLVDESNVQLILRELQAYVSWHSYPEFVALSVQSIAHVALKIPSVRVLQHPLLSLCVAFVIGAASWSNPVSVWAFLNFQPSAYTFRTAASGVLGQATESRDGAKPDRVRALLIYPTASQEKLAKHDVLLQRCDLTLEFNLVEVSSGVLLGSAACRVVPSQRLRSRRPGALAMEPEAMTAVPMQTSFGNLNTYFGSWPKRRSQFLIYGCLNPRRTNAIVSGSQGCGHVDIDVKDDADSATDIGSLYGGTPQSFPATGDGSSGGGPGPAEAALAAAHAAAAAAKCLGLGGVARRFKKGQKLAMVTAYDFPSSRLAREAGVELILVGDSLGNCRLGLPDTVGVTMEDMLRATSSVRRGVE
ncbi:unnamed protein product, partial [Polarella glacialis]